MSVVSDLICLARCVHQICISATNSKKAIRIAGEEVATVAPLLEMLQHTYEKNDGLAQEFGPMLSGLQTELEKMRQIVERATNMNRVLYHIKGDDIMEEISACMRHMQFLLGALSVRQGALGCRQRDDLQAQLEKFHKAWQEREAALQRQTEEQKKIKAELFEGDVTSNLLHITDGSYEELQIAQKAIQEEHDLLRKELQTSVETIDPDPQSKESMEEKYLLQVIAALKLAEERQQLEQQEQQQQMQQQWQQMRPGEMPPWALCPVTQEVMSDPVVLDSVCMHTCDRASINEWLARRHSTCPVCSTRLRSSHVAPNVQLRDAIEDVGFCLAAPRVATLSFPPTDVVPQTPDLLVLDESLSESGLGDFLASQSINAALEKDQHCPEEDPVHEGVIYEEVGDGPAGVQTVRQGVPPNPHVGVNVDAVDQRKIVTVTATRPGPDTKLGMGLTQKPGSGVVVDSLSPESIFQGTELRVGMKILTVNGDKCSHECAGYIAALLASTNGDVTIVAEEASPMKLATAIINKPTKDSPVGISLHDANNQRGTMVPIIGEVTEDGLFAKTPLEPGMRLLTINGESCRGQHHGIAMLRDAVGVITVDAGCLDLVMATVIKPASQCAVGLSLCTEESKLIVSSVDPNGLFAKTDLKEGMQILQVNGLGVDIPCIAAEIISQVEGTVSILARDIERYQEKEENNKVEGEVVKKKIWKGWRRKRRKPETIAVG